MSNHLNQSFKDRRPVVTCAGELEVFSLIEDNLSEALPKDTCEWKRSLGRPVKVVRIGANFTPFSKSALPRSGQWDLIRQPLFHIYWTECTDTDAYKINVKEDIENWLKELTSREIQDWLVVVVENYDGKRAKQLIPRTTVLDKIRAEFAPKQGDRCISVINPGKIENKSTDSWRGLVGRIRHLLLVAYARAVTQLEEYIRQQRERRNEPGWSFMKYFKLQEELAQILEMLGLNDEALVQYDELDAFFSQIVSSSLRSDSIKWLSDFQKPLERWYGLKLGPAILPESPSILELRAYIFAKQAHMLLLSNKIWEIAARCLPFLHTCTRELNLLEVWAPAGAVWCWLFLASMEVLHYCDKFNQADQVEEYSLQTAPLWEFASQKLRSLGELCGLMPKNTPTSEQLHIVVGLSAGMGDNPGPPNDPSPTDKLKEVLCSQELFNKLYLELAELAMGTFKHVGRLRMARLVGKDVASFYLLLGETQKTAAFLGDALRMFLKEGWHELAAQTQLEVAECFREIGDMRKLVKACTYVSAALEVDTLIRWTYFDEMMKNLSNLDSELEIPFDNVVKLLSVKVLNDSSLLQSNRIEVELIIESNFPKEVLCTYVAVSLEKHVKQKENERICLGKALSDKEFKSQDPLLQKLKIKNNLDYKQDKQLAMSGITSKLTELRRKDSTLPHIKPDFNMSLEVDKLPLLLTPGINVIRVSRVSKEVGKFFLGSVALHVNQLELVSAPLLPKLTIEVQEEGPSLKLYKRAAPLLAGIEQVMNLILTIGSYSIDPASKIKLIASPGLAFHTDPEKCLVNVLEMEVGERQIFTSTRIPLRIFAELSTKDHQVTIHVPWNAKPIVVGLTFTTPIGVTWRLFTCDHRKFVQVNVVGQYEKEIKLETPELKIKNIPVSPIFCESDLIITNGLSTSFLWELALSSESCPNSSKGEFFVKYKLSDLEENMTYQYLFDITDYQTLYVLDADVEPAKGNEFCRVGLVCHLNLTIFCEMPNKDRKEVNSVMYEVLAEQSVWAVCGRTAGVVCFDSEDDSSQQIVLDVMPLTSGYLPLPLVRISKYIPAENMISEKCMKGDTHPRLEPFSPGQVYNKSKGKQLHVIAASNDGQNS
ncbi:trafficking protein particle complex subunit 10 [Cylas formicarius]|uniref:trafficking protein particle complex subunit 10 n=1 Tax=Cylas formicarius TaxID=197179 RepID=UPI002958C035|nr:trafficking protein particle complex subunit 10 [Cylas formicarius]